MSVENKIDKYLNEEVYTKQDYDIEQIFDKLLAKKITKSQALIQIKKLIGDAENKGIRKITKGSNDKEVEKALNKLLGGSKKPKKTYKARTYNDYSGCGMAGRNC